MPSLFDVRQPLVVALDPNPAAIVWQLYVQLIKGKVPLIVQTQQETQWCWAAVSVSVSLFYDAGSGWTQCSMVDAEMGQDICCSKGGSAACNSPWYLNLALDRAGHLAAVDFSALSFGAVQTEVDNGQPPCSRIGWSGGGGHFVGIGGYRQLGESQWLTICDPFYGVSSQSLPVFQSSYQGSGTWTSSYRTQA
jgi:hypothetical protein